MIIREMEKTKAYDINFMELDKVEGGKENFIQPPQQRTRHEDEDMVIYDVEI